MIFVAGPRQSGKTTLANMISDSHVNRLYFNWDIPQDRARLIEHPFFFEDIERKNGSRPLIVLDEIHEYKDWKNYLKGGYDRFSKDFLFLVSGSSRLDIYQKGGDSLAGCYYQFHLWPFTLKELSETVRDIQDFRDNPLDVVTRESPDLEGIWSSLEKLSGFPEPYLTGRETSKHGRAARNSGFASKCRRELDMPPEHPSEIRCNRSRDRLVREH